MSLSKSTEMPTEMEGCVNFNCLILNNDNNNNNDPEASCFITDPIHGEIAVPEVCLAFLHSLEFDRLRSIKQLGQSYEMSIFLHRAKPSNQIIPQEMHGNLNNFST